MAYGETRKPSPFLFSNHAPMPEPTPVVIATDQQDPVPVTLAASPVLPLATVIKGEGQTLAPTTTEEGDRVTAGQRHISRVWEYSQAFIAIIVTGSTVYVLAKLAIAHDEVTANQLISAMQLNVMTTLILTFYFARTNHVAIGGVGKKADEGVYQGR